MVTDHERITLLADVVHATLLQLETALDKLGQKHHEEANIIESLQKHLSDEWPHLHGPVKKGK